MDDTTTQPRRSTPSHRPTEHRAANAHAASHGYGAARAMAHSLVANWSAEEAPANAAVIIDQPEQAQSYAESVEVPFEDYLTELRALRSAENGDSDGDGEDLYPVYAAGFDIGFRSALIEQCEAITTARESDRMPTA